MLRCALCSSLVALLAVAWLPTLGAAEPPASLQGLPLVFADDFQTGDLDRWELTDSNAWKLTRQGDNQVFSLTVRQSNFTPPVRSPFNRALVKDLTLGNLVLDVRLQSTLDTGAHRDLCLFFGYQDDSHLYYVHLGRATDDHANQIFIVNGEPRKKISRQRRGRLGRMVGIMRVLYAMSPAARSKSISMIWKSQRWLRRTRRLLGDVWALARLMIWVTLTRSASTVSW
jgi:hypothetical protein